MYYKVFYLLFNHVSLIDVFFKDKKIFYNFSKYFQINLYLTDLQLNKFDGVFMVNSKYNYLTISY